MRALAPALAALVPGQAIRWRLPDRGLQGARAFLAGEAGRLLRGSTLLVAGTMAGNALNVVYTFLMARLLAPPDYATLVALTALFIVASLPAGTIQTVVAREVALAEAAGEAGRAGAIARRLLARLLPVALLVSAGLLALTSSAASYLQVRDPAPLRVLALLLGALLLLPVLRGALQGLQRFGTLAALGLLDVLFKLVLGAALVWLGYGVTGAFAAMLAGAGAGLALTAVALGWGRRQRSRPAPDPRDGSHWRVGPLVSAAGLAEDGQPPAGGAHWRVGPPAPAGGERPDPSPAPWRPSAPGEQGARLSGGWRYALVAFLALGGLNGLVTLDSVLVKHFFPPEAAGAYAAVSVLGRSLFWAAGAITLVVLPLAARRSAVPTGALPAPLPGPDAGADAPSAAPGGQPERPGALGAAVALALEPPPAPLSELAAEPLVAGEPTGGSKDPPTLLPQEATQPPWWPAQDSRGRAGARWRAWLRRGDLLWLSGGAVLALGLAAQALFLVAPGQLLRLLFGPAYIAAAPLLPRYGWSALCLALASVVLTYQLGLGRVAPAVVAPLGLALQVGLMVAFHRTLEEVVLALIVANAALLGGSLLTLRFPTLPALPAALRPRGAAVPRR